MTTLDTAPPAPRRSSAPAPRLDKAFGGFLAHAVLVLGAAFVLLPLVWMLLTSIRSADSVFTAGFNPIPSEFHGLTNYGQALANSPLLQFMLNGAIVCAGILVVQLTCAIPAGYALAKLDFRARPLLFGLVLFGLTVPPQVTALPIYMALSSIGMLNTYFAVMVPFFLSVFAIFLFRQFFKTFPQEIIAAARLDGFTEFEIIIRLIVPSAVPAIAAFSIFSVTSHWNDLYWPLVVTTDPGHATPPLGMMLFRDQETGSNYGALMAGAAIITAPLVVVFLFAQRHFIRGITMTGVK
ncbi:MAG: carbohydrate ABC transporter permease [Hyphomicrobiaceae bacterium]|nr:carbohydrate ABC transporter permease [Hyphomicrobiaceae bacterium]